MVCKVGVWLWLRAVFLDWGARACVAAFLYSAFANSSVIVAWNPSSSSNVVSYNIYYGLASGNYNNMIFVGGSTNGTITGLANGTNYYFAVASVDIFGDEGSLSKEIVYSVPINSNSPAPILEPIAPPSNGLFALTVNGLAGHIYVVQVSTDMVNWVPIVTNVSPFTFVGTNVNQFKQQFYRSYYIP
jgi:hypothetical protein